MVSFQPLTLNYETWTRCPRSLSVEILISYEILVSFRIPLNIIIHCINSKGVSHMWNHTVELHKTEFKKWTYIWINIDQYAVSAGVKIMPSSLTTSFYITLCKLNYSAYCLCCWNEQQKVTVHFCGRKKERKKEIKEKKIRRTERKRNRAIEREKKKNAEALHSIIQSTAIVKSHFLVISL